MPFEKVSSGGGGAGTEPKISLRKSGSIGVNNAALEEFFGDDDEYVELYYDEEENQLGLKGLSEDSDDSFTLSRSDSGGSVTPMSFLRSQSLIPDVTTQYSPDTQSINGDTELVVVDLDDPIGTYGSPDDESERDSET